MGIITTTWGVLELLIGHLLLCEVVADVDSVYLTRLYCFAVCEHTFVLDFVRIHARADTSVVSWS